MAKIKEQEVIGIPSDMCPVGKEESWLIMTNERRETLKEELRYWRDKLQQAKARGMGSIDAIESAEENIHYINAELAEIQRALDCDPVPA